MSYEFSCERCDFVTYNLFGVDVLGRTAFHCRGCTERPRAIRAVVAAQWAIACVLFGAGRGHGMQLHPIEWSRSEGDIIRAVGALPTPEQIVDGEA